MSISRALIKELRQRTGAGMSDIKRALFETNGDIERAYELLQERGLIAKMAASGEIKESLIGAYVLSGKTGAMVEITYETNFVVRDDRNKVFQNLARDIAWHIAASAPRYLSRQEIPAEELEKERQNYIAAILEEGTPEQMAAKMAEERMENLFYKKVVLLEQAFLKDHSKNVEAFIKEHTQPGENIVLRRFVRFAIGETKEGLIGSYIHLKGKEVSMVEITCETDFVARHKVFQNLARDIAHHIVTNTPRYLSRQEIPAQELEKMRQIYIAAALKEGKPERVANTIAEGRLMRYCTEVTLLEQPIEKDASIKIEDLIKKHIALLGEKIVVRRFVRFSIED